LGGLGAEAGILVCEDALAAVVQLQRLTIDALSHKMVNLGAAIGGRLRELDSVTLTVRRRKLLLLATEAGMQRLDIGSRLQLEVHAFRL
jgi:hypothetical protein